MENTLLRQAMILVVKMQYASTSLFTRKFNIKYTQAMILMEQLEELKIVDFFDGKKEREVLIKSKEDLQPILNKL